MSRAILNAIMLIALPTAVFLAGAWAMTKLVHRDQVTRQLGEKANAADRKPLNRRICGYGLADVERHWGALDRSALGIERRFLEFDLVFPTLYGAALVGALLLAWLTLGRPFHAGWLFLPVTVTIVADWTENLAQLSQLHSYICKGKDGLQATWIHVASLATTLKLVFLIASCLLLASMAVWVVCRAFRPPS
jgi:hypothetical protein